VGEVRAHPPHELSEPREQEDSAPPPAAERTLLVGGTAFVLTLPRA
jgi:hypothetical protein